MGPAACRPGPGRRRRSWCSYWIPSGRMAAKHGKNEAERWFERYLREHGYSYEYEPDLGVATRPDFLVRQNEIEVVCEVKGFDQIPALEQRLSGTNQPVMASTDEVYGPMRGAVR